MAGGSAAGGCRRACASLSGNTFAREHYCVFTQPLGVGRTDTLCLAQKRPQNRFKCLRRTFIPPRQKLALYGALKRAVKILRILLPSKCRYKYINNQSFSLASTDLERVGLTILQILQILQAETRQGVS